MRDLVKGRALGNRYQLAHLGRQLGLYTAVAVIGLLVDFGVLVGTTSGLRLHYLVGTTTGFLSGLVVTYVLSERFVFSDPRITNRVLRFASFGLIGLVGLLILNGLMWLLTDVAGFFYLWSKVLATFIVYGWNFFARRALYGNRPSGAASNGL